MLLRKKGPAKRAGQNWGKTLKSLKKWVLSHFCNGSLQRRNSRRFRAIFNWWIAPRTRRWPFRLASDSMVRIDHGS
jgi:hypothetical protein